ncbi:MAG: DUF4129 domain-containing protein [Cellvibrionaceae bacterium]|nr:DUF4129 domain-containing protein [Cellvibrionaceae bacterium]
MNLERIRIAIRPRRDWEAVDLGLQMARQWWWPMLRVWLIITMPWLIAAWLVPPYYQWLVSVSLWWCKPLFERPLLMILSQGVFGVKLRTREVLRATPRLFLLQIFPSLTWRRFSFTRSMDLPVVQLEGLHGAERRARLNVLHRVDSGPASWLTIIGVHVESFVMMACAALLAVFIPPEVADSLWRWEFWGESRAGGALLIVFAYVAMAIMGPLFVACGFALYLNRRVKLEGWDLEIAFKRMAQKRGVSALVLLALLALPLAPPAIPTAQAQSERERIREEIIAIKQGPDFHRMETQRVIKAKENHQEINFNEGFWQALLDFFSGAGKAARAVASIAEIALWVVVLVAVVFLILKYGSWLERFPQLLPGRRRRAEYRPQTLFGMAVTRESLPEDVSAAAGALWQAGERRQALALLYRASLASLLQVGMPLREGSTEQECLRLVERLQAELDIPAESLRYFAHLTRAWSELAYGHLAPHEHEGLELCRDWNRLWPEVRHG